MSIICKSCGSFSKHNYKGFCQRCYVYFIVNGYEKFEGYTEFGKLSYVEDKNSKQYGMPICHICEKAYDKLQSHIYHTHHTFKEDYCRQFGLDKSSQLTSPKYHKKMSDYAYAYDMPSQLKVVGKDTRFKAGGNNGKYDRSPMTMNRLKKNAVTLRFGGDSNGN